MQLENYVDKRVYFFILMLHRLLEKYQLT